MPDKAIASLSVPQRIEDSITHYGGVHTDEEIHSMMQTAPLHPTDGKWYWVHYEGLGKTYEAAALYRESAKAFYSVDFSGIPLHQVEVISECAPLLPKKPAPMSDSQPDLDSQAQDAKRWNAVKPLFRVGNLNIDGNHTWLGPNFGKLVGASMNEAADKLIGAK